MTTVAKVRGFNNGGCVICLQTAHHSFIIFEQIPSEEGVSDAVILPLKITKFFSRLYPPPSCFRVPFPDFTQNICLLLPRSPNLQYFEIPSGNHDTASDTRSVLILGYPRLARLSTST